MNVGAAQWRRDESLSLGGRLYLALGECLDATGWTADKDWGLGPGGAVRFGDAHRGGVSE